jgi:hypothetical protein
MTTKLKDGYSKITGWIYLHTLKIPPSQNLKVKENNHLSTKLQLADALEVLRNMVIVL